MSESKSRERRHQRVAVHMPVRISTIDPETDPRTGRPYFRAWLYAATVTLAISLVFDTYDLIQYIGGTREPMVEYYAQ